MAKLRKLMGVLLGLLLFVPVGTAIWLGFEPMSAVITYSWGTSIITSEVKSFMVNPPLIFFLGALAYSLYTKANGFIIAAALSFFYSFLTLWLVWSGGRGEWYGLLFYAVIFTIVGLGGASAAALVRFLYHKIKKGD
ncbi:hypothetical protein Psch_01416 [Pelotomaculum schinkii]|uniref:Uncharacterized protein n=1 Tax=Pelotomaculum schinkii TaxID=78350 RepID=A0A4Y7RGF8_9FIRM|nr:hypothetical protein [Pelotomaculum schinkii]TEB07861.1 hypothetical protein Psch_01416 [Pelotomaculum schinkii]